MVEVEPTGAAETGEEAGSGSTAGAGAKASVDAAAVVAGTAEKTAPSPVTGPTKVDSPDTTSPMSAASNHPENPSPAGGAAEAPADAVEVEVMQGGDGSVTVSAYGSTTMEGDGTYEFKIESPRSDSLPEIYRWPLAALVSFFLRKYAHHFHSLSRKSYVDRDPSLEHVCCSGNEKEPANHVAEPETCE